MSLQFHTRSSTPLFCSIPLHRCGYQNLKRKHKILVCEAKNSNFNDNMEVISAKRNVMDLQPIEVNRYRRNLMLCGLLGPFFCTVPAKALDEDNTISESNYAIQIDEINSYMYAYPLDVPSRRYKLKWITSRKPERYSSAAPLAPDARQRIVSEILDIKDNLVISVSIGPPNKSMLAVKDKNAWDAKDVAKSVLSDKSTARLTTGQKVTETSIIEAHSDKVDGEPYWYYEHVSRKSPTTTEQRRDVFRHSIAVTAERDGYLYSLNASALSSTWKTIEPLFKKTVSSFHLLPQTENYVPPYKDPWRFW